MGLLSNRVSREDLCAGDHIYSWRFAYSYAHHGIYVGDGSVIHFTRGAGEEIGTGTVLDKFASSISSSWKTTSFIPCEKCGVGIERNGVVQSCLDCFLCGCPLYRFQYKEHSLIFLAKARGGTCTLAVSDPLESVLHRANYLLANGFGCYHIFHNNCEDFAIYCKTGLLVLEQSAIGRSGQAASFLGAPFAAVSASPLRFLMAQPWGLIAVSAGVYCLSRYATDIGVRRDVAKISVEDLVVRLGPAMSTETSGNQDLVVSLGPAISTETSGNQQLGSYPDITQPESIPKICGNQQAESYPETSGDDQPESCPKISGNLQPESICKVSGGNDQPEVSVKRLKLTGNLQPISTCKVSGND